MATGVGRKTGSAECVAVHAVLLPNVHTLPLPRRRAVTLVMMHNTHMYPRQPRITVEEAIATVLHTRKVERETAAHSHCVCMLEWCGEMK